MKTLSCATLTSALLLLCAGVASAQDAPAQPPNTAPGKIHLAVDSPPTGNSRTYHRHEGFYFRANFGPGLLWGNYDDSGTNDADLDANGTGIGLDLLIGGSPSPGVAIGGGLITDALFSASFERNDRDEADRDVQVGTIGVFIDGFPQVTGGWHLGGLIGLSGLSLSKGGFVDDTGGFGGAAWVGYDEWVAADWALGGLVRFSATRTRGEEDVFDVTASNATLSVMFTALYH